MLLKEKMDRINVLAKKSKQETLTPDEKKEQEELRAEYLKSFREHFKRHLETIRFSDDNPNNCVEKGKEKQ
ncbi:MAG: DUF896 domain-containing protein [Eubacteriales bacterium]|nr:DUF896 domain-containing protein [Eubacteriales bacterium]MDD3199554.1 DUF896 domain-containing protein [Eubacteriales bacterium]MDD4122236.1 DUF896 domain-containing protein [Eubacteriales bacterium]MDD4629839.1 DUF896 domain-containing protein [Eubacteriales bacterium]